MSWDCLLAVAADLTEADELMIAEAQAHRAPISARCEKGCISTIVDARCSTRCCKKDTRKLQ